MVTNKLEIERKEEGDHLLFFFKGIIDEDAHLSEVFINLKPNVILNLEEVHLINSCGVREWILALKQIPSDVKLQYDKCSPRIIEQINYISNFIGPGQVTSFYAPYFCPSCKAEVNVLLRVSDLKQIPLQAPAQKCPTCQSPLEFDDIEEEYFSFLEPNP